MSSMCTVQYIQYMCIVLVCMSLLCECLCERTIVTVQVCMHARVCVCVRACMCVLFVHCMYLLYTYQDTACAHRCICICMLCISVLINIHSHNLRL